METVMKKRIISAILLLSLVISSLTGCLAGTGAGGTEEGGGTEADKGVEAVALTAADRCRAEPSFAPYSSFISFRDASRYYYVLELGTLRNVPLDSAESKSFATGTETLKLTASGTTEEAISNILLDVERASTVGAFSEGGIAKDEVRERVEQGFAQLNTATPTKSKSLYNARAYSSLHANHITVNMTDKPSGHYRYSLVGDVRVYVAVVYDIKTGKYSYEPYSVIIAESYMLEYSETLEFTPSPQKLTFAFDEAQLRGKVPSTEILPKPVYYDSGYDRKEIDASHSYIYDTFDISALSEYMTGDYKLTFAIRINMAEIASGYQEVYLNNAQGEHVGANMAIEYGGSGKAETTAGWYDSGLTFTVDGELCTPRMHLEYGAHGEHSDDWVRYQTQVTVTVSRN